MPDNNGNQDQPTSDSEDVPARRPDDEVVQGIRGTERKSKDPETENFEKRNK